MTRAIFGQTVSAADIAELAGISVNGAHERLTRMSPLMAAILPGKRLVPIAGGTRFERLVVVREAGRTNAGKRTYECKCDCGNTKTVIGADLKSGRTLSCGCLRDESTAAARESEAEDLTGQTFANGLVRVIARGELVERKQKSRASGHRIREWICECSCGARITAKAAALRKGQVTSCGCRRSARARQNAKSMAPRHDYFGQKLTVPEIAAVCGIDAPTLRYRMSAMGLSAQEAATMEALPNNPALPNKSTGCPIIAERR